MTPKAPAELMARHLHYRGAPLQQAAYLSAYERWQDQQHHEALQVVARIHQRKEMEAMIRRSGEQVRAPAPNRLRRLAARVGVALLALTAVAAGAALLVGGGA